MFRQLLPVNNEWVIDRVNYSYPGRIEKVLKDISFNIRPKEKIAIVGLNGAGKTTLMKLMLRLLEPDLRCDSILRYGSRESGMCCRCERNSELCSRTSRDSS